jgi:uncharacterized protein (TIGR04255 family)
MYEAVCYQKSFLKQVIVRFDFVAPIPGIEKALPQKLGTVFSDHFPILEPRDAITHEVEILAASGEPKHRQKAFKEWVFFGKNREKQLSFSSSYLFVVHTVYSTYEGMKTTVSAVISSLQQTYPDTRISRFGLRYINNIEIDGVAPVTGWGEYIAPNLIATIPFFEPDNLARLVSISEVRCGELNLRFQFGMPNPDFPSPIKRPSFILDLDAYIQTAHEIPVALQYMENAHGCIQHLFEKSITDNLRGRMGVKAAV